MRKILVVLAMALCLFGISALANGGLELGFQHDIAQNEASAYGQLTIGDMDVHGFQVEVGTKDVLDWDDRWLYASAEYFLGYIQSDSKVAGLTFGGGVNFEPYVDWHGSPDYDWFGFYVRGDVFDMFPEIYPEIAIFGQLGINVDDSSLEFNGIVGGSINFPW